MKNNCIRCKHYLKCKDPHKSIIFICDRFSKVNNGQDIDILQDMVDAHISKEQHIIVPDTHESLSAYNEIKRIITSDQIVSPDIRFPESDFAAAPNFYTWCVSQQFLDQKPYTPQAVIGTVLFSEYCPRCSDLSYLENYEARDSLKKFENKIALLDQGVCPHCGATRYDFARNKEIKYYYELALAAGQRSGKSALLGMMFSYLTHRMLKLERPNEVYGLLKATVLQCTFVALTYAQAKDTLWEPYYGNLLDSPWFNEYHNALDEVESHYGENTFYNLKDSFVLYKHRRLYIYPAGPDKRVLRGRTRFGGAIDEIGWFPNDKDAAKNIKMNADEVYTAIERSLLTVRVSADRLMKQRRFNVPTGYFLNISSPSSIRDKIMELVRKAQFSTKIYGIQRPTWKMNPTIPYNSATIQEEFRKDPVTAMRDYGAEPPLNSSPFISNSEHIESCFYRPNKLRLNYKIKKYSNGSQELYATVERAVASKRPSVLALDAGFSNNSFAFAVGHLHNGMPIISLVGEIIPRPDAKINFSLVYEKVLEELVLECNIAIAAADRWNSLKMLSDLTESYMIEKRQYSLKYADIVNVKSCIESHTLGLPKCKRKIADILQFDQSKYPMCFKDAPEEHLVVQLLTVQDTGLNVIKGENLTDDIARAVFLCVHQLLDEKNQEFLHTNDSSDDEEEQKPTLDVRTLFAMTKYSGGSQAVDARNTSLTIGYSIQRK